MNDSQWTIREASPSERDLLGGLHRAAFGPGEGPVVAGLVEEMLDDPTAQPLLSLVAVSGAGVLGHVLFSAVRVGDGQRSVPGSILAPLAVRPELQGRGLGGVLVRAGLQRLRDRGVGLVFVLGHIDYYPRFGFEPAGERGFEAPYPIPPAVADAWMVQELRPGLLDATAGTVRCCAALDHPEHWQE